MTEFDFEELDKAVSDLMKDNGTPYENESAEADKAPNESSPVTHAVKTTSSAPLAVKRRGKFMDVMHSPKAMSSRPLANHGSTAITPAVSVEAKQAEELSANSQVEVVSETETPQANDYAANPAPISEWPDPIDVHNDNPDEPVNSDEASEPSASVDVNSDPVEQPDIPEAGSGTSDQTEPGPPVEPEQVEPTPPADALDTVIEPEFLPETSDSQDIPEEVVAEAAGTETEVAMESPFLPDAKVEKRPLGGLVQGEAAAGVAIEPSAGAAVQSNQANPELPRELSSELMGLESSTSPIMESSESQDDNVSTLPQSEAAPTEPATQPEIKQQYTEQPSSGDKTSGAIYDTANYHQPIVAQSGKKHKWLLYVIWVLVLLIVGACAGALYFYLSTR